MNSILKLLILVSLGLAACTTCPDETLGGDPPGYSSPQFSGHDDKGRLMIKERGLVWKRHVAVYSVDKKLEADAHHLVEMNFGVNLVPVPDSHFLVRLIPDKKGHITVSTQFNGSLAQGPLLNGNSLSDEKVQIAFLEFVNAQMDKASSRK
jgi:hypothetical protein